MAVEDIDDAREVQQRSRQPVHLVDDHAVDPARLHLGHQPPKRGALHAPPGEAAVVVAIGQQDPALVALAGDKRLGRLALSVERVEVLIKPLVRGLAGVHGAADLDE